MTLHRKTLFIAGASLLVVAVAAIWFRPHATEVEGASVREGPMEAIVAADGRTRVRERYVITSPVPGRIARIALVEGSVVHTGDVVARIAPQPLDEPTAAQARARLDAAEALARDAHSRAAVSVIALERQRKELARSQRLLDAGAIAPRDFESAQLACKGAEADSAAAAEHVHATDADARQARAALLAIGGGAQAEVAVRAPSAGTVLRVYERSERVAPPGTPLIDVGDPRTMEAVIDVLSSDAATIAPGYLVRLSASGGAVTDSLDGCVRVVEPSAFTKVSALGVDEQRVNVIVDLTTIPRAIGDGYRLDAQIVTWRTERAIVAPVSALVRAGTEWQAFVVENGRARLRTVTLRHVNGTSAEVVSGLAAGDAVILFPSDVITDGTRVTVRR